MKTYREILKKYLPEGSVDRVLNWLDTYKIQLKITKSRNTKLGDYRSPLNGGAHRISINHDLNPYAFLITFVHELAHLIVWEKYRYRAKPHGKEWKEIFRQMMQPLLAEGIFPEEVVPALVKYLANAKAASGSDEALTIALKKYDTDSALILEDLPVHTSFRIPSGRAFVKGEKLRKRYRCVCLQTKRTYLVNPLVKVYPLKKE